MGTQTFDEWPDFLTTQDLANMLQLPSVMTVYEWNKKRTGPPYYRVDRRLLYRKSEVLKWLERRDASLD
jgi:predicted DNA-binding transcriptional regulator AlpA